MNKKKKDLNKDWTKAKEIIPGGNSFFSKRLATVKFAKVNHASAKFA